jgi:hypothetical protein
MKKIPIEVLRSAGEKVTVIIPDKLNNLEILGIAEQVLLQLGIPSVHISIRAKADQ